MDRRLEVLCSSALLVFVLGACEADRPPPDIMPQAPTCSSTEQDVADIDVVTPLGSSAREILDRHAVPMVGQLEWTPSGDGYELLLSTGTEPVDLTVSLTYEGGRIRFLEQELVVPDGQVNDIGVICPDVLRIEVTLDVSTGDGALAESWGTDLTVSDDPEMGEPSDPGVRVDVDLAELMGTFTIVGIEPTTWSVSDGLRVLVEFAPGGSSGRIQTGVTDPEGRTRTVEIGTWQASAS